MRICVPVRYLLNSEKHQLWESISVFWKSTVSLYNLKVKVEIFYWNPITECRNTENIAWDIFLSNFKRHYQPFGCDPIFSFLCVEQCFSFMSRWFVGSAVVNNSKEPCCRVSNVTHLSPPLSSGSRFWPCLHCCKLFWGYWKLFVRIFFLFFSLFSPLP